jgi:glycogen debranching enzyme
MSESGASAPTFYIPAVGLGLERSRILKHGDTFAVFDVLGDLSGLAGGVEGLYFRDTRHLSFLRLRIHGQPPLFLSSSVQRNNARLNVDLANPDLWMDGRLELPRDSVHIRRMKFIWDDTLYDVLTVRNFTGKALTLTLGLEFGADFRDLFEVRGVRRERRGSFAAETEDNRRVWLRYHGLDGLRRSTRIEFSLPPTELTVERAEFLVQVAPGGRIRLAMTVRCDSDGTDARPVLPFAVGVRRAHQARISGSRRLPAVETSDELFNEWLCRSTADLVMLTTDTPHGPYPYAGIPWFSTVFGRDGLLTAYQVLWANPDYARGVLRFLAAHQADRFDPSCDAEPGKVLHEMRQCEMARTGEIPFGRYYGSVDATPLFVWLAAEYYRRTGDLDTVKGLYPHVQRAVEWFDRAVDARGFLTYGGESASGLRNQGWKDSEDAVFHAGGELARGPIALSEVQGYLYAARRAAAALARLLGDGAFAEAQEQRAAALRQQFERHFWLPEKNFYALALDGALQPCRVLTSNPGHLLLTDVCEPARARAVAERLRSSQFFSGWGVRTVAVGAARYNPMSYHNGSVWPHDNALIAMGCARQGDRAGSLAIFQAMFEAAVHMELRRLPELFCGFSRRRDAGPTLYPVACAPQAWAAAVPWALLGAVLGLAIDHARSTLVLTHPCLPRFLNWVRIRGLGVLGGELTLQLRRTTRTVAVEVEEATAGLHVEVRP